VGPPPGAPLAGSARRFRVWLRSAALL